MNVKAKIVHKYCFKTIDIVLKQCLRVPFILRVLYTNQAQGTKPGWAKGEKGEREEKEECGREGEKEKEEERKGGRGNGKGEVGGQWE